MMILTWLDKPIIYFLDKCKKISKNKMMIKFLLISLLYLLVLLIIYFVTSHKKFIIILSFLSVSYLWYIFVHILNI